MPGADASSHRPCVTPLWCFFRARDRARNRNRCFSSIITCRSDYDYEHLFAEHETQHKICIKYGGHMRKKPTSTNLPASEQATKRTYRQLVKTRLKAMRVVVQETDLSVYADCDVSAAAKEAIVRQRGYIENYIRRHPEFASRLTPWPADHLASPIVREMIEAGRDAQVGPMAAVAGAVAEHVGRSLRSNVDQVVIENGGDLYADASRDLRVAVYAARSPLSMKIGLKIGADQMPLAVCTSSATVGHSLSRGRADAVCVLSKSGALADAAATAIGNRVLSVGDIDPAIQWGRTIEGVTGILIVLGDKMGVWGRIELVPLELGNR